MAYNREWDQAKDWNDPTAWDGTDRKANIRPREEDYYAEGKRRKFNNGVCPTSCLLRAGNIMTGLFRDFKAMMVVKHMKRVGTTSVIPRVDQAIIRKTMVKMTVNSALVSPRKDLHHLNQVHMLFFLDWTQTLRRPMSVDSPLVFYVIITEACTLASGIS
jgi:hypothetical protein